MATESITLQVDAEAARAYWSISDEERKRIQMLLGLWLGEIAAGDADNLKHIMDEIGRKAKARGLTAEKLQALLEEG